MTDDGFPSWLWNAAYEAVGPSRDQMWDWLEAKLRAAEARCAALEAERNAAYRRGVKDGREARFNAAGETTAGAILRAEVAEAECAALEAVAEAARTFADFGSWAATRDENGGAMWDANPGEQNQPITVWFGPSDFRNLFDALAALVVVDGTQKEAQ